MSALRREAFYPSVSHYLPALLLFSSTSLHSPCFPNVSEKDFFFFFQTLISCLLSLIVFCGYWYICRSICIALDQKLCLTVLSQQCNHQLLGKAHKIGKNIFLVCFLNSYGICLREFVQNTSSVMCWNSSHILPFSIASRTDSNLYALLEAKELLSERAQEHENVNPILLLQR